MGLETGTYIGDLNSANPVAGDPRNEGDDHLRLIKASLQATFPGMAGRFGRTQSKSANYTAVEGDNSSILNFTATGLTLSLTAAATLGNGWFAFVVANGFDLTIDPDGVETINGLSTVTLQNGGALMLFCTGTAFLGVPLGELANVGLHAIVRTAATGSAKIPVGTEAQRDGIPASGYLRFNDDTKSLEVYNGTAWVTAGQGATGGGTDRIFVLNGQTVTSDYTIPTGFNAHSVGPIEIADTVEVTISDGSNWLVS
jgi:hypothetical protein